MEPAFESAYNRYGMAPWNRRAYHACSRGPVVDSRKYGRPTVTASNPRIRSVGSSPPVGFHEVLGYTGSASALTSSRPA